MTRVKLNLASGSVQEREVVTAFNSNGIKYIVFDGESSGSMGLPIILVSKENMGKVVGITDAEEWKNTKECLKKIISGEGVEYAAVKADLNADDIYYRQLTLPIASFDVLKSSYKAPAEEVQTATDNNQTPIFEPITPEDITGSNVQDLEPVAPSVFNAPVQEVPAAQEQVVSPIVDAPAPMPEAPVTEPAVQAEESNPSSINYDELKSEFMTKAEELFDSLYAKLNR